MESDLDTQKVMGPVRELTPQEIISRRVSELRAEANRLELLAESMPQRMHHSAVEALRNMLLKSQ